MADRCHVHIQPSQREWRHRKRSRSNKRAPVDSFLNSKGPAVQIFRLDGVSVGHTSQQIVRELEK